MAKGRVDYSQFNYCAKCDIKYLKFVSRCSDCGQALRRKPLITPERQRARAERRKMEEQYLFGTLQ